MSHRSFSVSSGSVSIPVYHSVSPAGYHEFRVAWRLGSKRQRKNFSDATKARAFAQDIADRIANGRSGEPSLTQAELDEYREARRLLGPLSLLDAAREFARVKAKVIAPTVAQAGIEYLAFKRALPRRRPLNPEYLRNLAQRLDVIGAAFPCGLDHLRAADVQDWINALAGSLRTKNNYLADLRMLVTHAKRQRWLPPTFDELDRVHLERAGPGVIQPYSPEEAAAILRHCQRHDPRWLPWLPVRMFSGVRAAESMRLTVDHLQNPKWIAAGADITKTQIRRLLPVLPNLRRWLDAYPPADVLCPFGNAQTLSPLLTKLIRRAGIEPRHNGFRDSYASHRLAILQDASKVAEETGHAPAQLRRSYREIALPDGRLITPQLAKRYFSILPKPV